MTPRRLIVAIVVALALIVPLGTSAQINRHDMRFTLTAALNGAEEVPPGDPDGFGFARIIIDLDTLQLCYRLSVARTDVPTAAHIHIGARGVAGPVVVPLAAPTEGLVRGCTDVTNEVALAIITNPADYYVNVHTAEFPPGAVRGQLELRYGIPPATAP